MLIVSRVIMEVFAVYVDGVAGDYGSVRGVC